MSSTPTGDSKEPTTNVTEDFRHDPSVSKMPPTEVDGAAALPPPELGGGRYVFCDVIGQGDRWLQFWREVAKLAH